LISVCGHSGQSRKSFVDECVTGSLCGSGENRKFPIMMIRAVGGKTYYRAPCLTECRLLRVHDGGDTMVPPVVLDRRRNIVVAGYVERKTHLRLMDLIAAGNDNLHLLQTEAGKGQLSVGGPYSTGATVILLSPDGKLPLEGAILRKDLPKDAVSAGFEKVPKVTKVRWSAKSLYAEQSLIEQDATRPIASLPLIPAIKRVPTAIRQVAEPTVTRLDDDGGGKLRAIDDDVIEPRKRAGSRFRILDSDDDDDDGAIKPSAMVATKRPAQQQPMSNLTNVDYFASMVSANSPQKKKRKKYESNVDYFASVVSANSTQKKEWKKHESDYWKKYESDDDGYVSGASF